MSWLEQEIAENIKWLENVAGEHPDVVVDDLPSPELSINGRTVVSFCSNNYFGLSKHPDVIDSARRAMNRYGIGTCESRRLGGNLQILEDLENSIAKFKDKDSAVIFPTGLLTNMATIPTLTDTSFYRKLFWGSEMPDEEVPVILSDELNHRSIQMGIRLSRADSFKYKHADTEDLEHKLRDNRGRKVLIITDGVFSMDGDMAPLDRITRLSNKYGAMLMVDDAHGTGIYGRNGRGSGEHFDVSKDIDVHMGTFSKTFGGLGGFVAVNADLAKAIKYTSSGYYFTSSLPAEQAAGLITSIKIVSNTPSLRRCLWNNVEQVTRGLTGIGVEIPNRWSHIIPIHVGDDSKAQLMEELLLERGILCSSVHAPAVPRGTARLRITINSTHTQEHINTLLEAVHDMANLLNLTLQPKTSIEVSASFGIVPG